MNSSMELQSLKPKTVDHSHSNIREKVFSCTNKKKKRKRKKVFSCKSETSTSSPYIIPAPYIRGIYISLH